MTEGYIIRETTDKYPGWYQSLRKVVTVPSRYLEGSAFAWLPAGAIYGAVVAAPVVGVAGAVGLGAAGAVVGFAGGYALLSGRIFGTFDGNGSPSYIETALYHAEKVTASASKSVGALFNRQSKKTDQQDTAPEQKPVIKTEPPQIK